MKKPSLRYIIDVLLFVAFCSTAAVGLMLGLVIPKGAGRGPAGFLGLSRHQWGDMHLALALMLLVFLSLHLWLNWNWITATTRRLYATKWKTSLLIIGLAWLAVVVAAWLVMLV